MKEGGKKRIVVIVGAGASGLEAANVLLTHQKYVEGRLEVVVLEGRDRIGGRVSVHTTWDKPFDTGANFIHGTTLNPLMPLVEASDARLTFPDDTTPTVYGTLGKRLSPQTAQLAYDRVWKYSQEAIGYSSLEGPISPELSVNEFCLARLYADDALTNKVKTITKHLFHLLSDFTGTDAEKQSLRHYKVEATLPGESPFLASTYDPILTALANLPRRESIIRLSAPVNHISINDDSLDVQVADEHICADAVICTIPLGCLKRDTVTFEPPLPSRVQCAIDNLGYGNLEKVFLRFERPWWTTGVESPESSPIFHIFLPPRSLPPKAPKRALQVFSLAELPVNAQPVLAFYLSDKWSSYIALLSPSEIALFFRTHYLPLLPNYNSECCILDVFFTNWSADPFAFGSYTHVPVGSVDGINDLRILGEQIFSLKEAKGGLWFAGEHAGLADLATVNGALSSGKQAAIHVLHELFGKKEQEI